MNSSTQQHTIILPTVHPSGSSTGTKPRLLVMAGPLEGHEYTIHKFPYTIGSGLTNDLSISDPTVSRHHCEVHTNDAGDLIIQDLQSTNGTSIEGVKVTSARLSPNTVIQLGRTRILLPLVQNRPELTMSAREQFGNSIGRSSPIRHVFYLAEQAAASLAPVLLLGETGTGKEELAEDIHDASPRKDEPFIVVDCNGLTETESAKRELFGDVTLRGALDLASGGTLFIDSIDRLPQDLHPLLLRAIETRQDVRIISASKADLPAMVKEESFYPPLFSALSVLTIELPPLRRRKEDIPLLIRQLCDRYDLSESLVQWFKQDATISFLKRYNWPGNIRELRTFIERLHVMGCIPADIGAFLQTTEKVVDQTEDESSSAAFTVSADRPFKDAKNDLIEEFERKYLSDLLARNAQNISLSARNAGIERTYLQRLIRKYGMRNAE